MYLATKIDTLHIKAVHPAQNLIMRILLFKESLCKLNFALLKNCYISAPLLKLIFKIIHPSGRFSSSTCLRDVFLCSAMA